MSAGVAVLNMLGSDQWNAGVYGSLSVASKVSSIVRGKVQVLQLGYHLHTLNGRLKTFFNEVQETIENPASAKTPEQPPTPEQVNQSIESLRELSIKINGVYERSKRMRLTNYSMLAGGLSRLHTYAEDLYELADWLEMLRDPESYEAAFRRAANEREQGQVFSLSEVE